MATEAMIAHSYFPRLVGLLGRTKRWAQPGRGLWIVPSRGVHTIGMLFPIDLIFLSKEKQVVHVERACAALPNLRGLAESFKHPWLPAHTIYRTGTKIGDQLEIARLNK